MPLFAIIWLSIVAFVLLNVLVLRSFARHARPRKDAFSNTVNTIQKHESN